MRPVRDIREGMILNATAASNPAKPATAEPTVHDLKLIVTVSTLGTVFEWYDFYIYATLAPLFAKLFFPGSSPTAGLLLALATFGIGFAARPVGGAIFGALGDRIGRKTSFLVTISMMGLATTAIGLLGTYNQIGIAAPICLVLLRTLQGLAVGGQYGGAAIYVTEHAPANRRGFYTGFIQTGASLGFMLSMIAVLVTSTLVGEEEWIAWGWRIPFILSLGLLAVSIWMRLKLGESPVFAAMQKAGEVARQPLREAFATRARVGRLVTVMIGIAVGQSVAGYVGLIQAMNYLTTAAHMEPTSMRIVLIASMAFGAVASWASGWLSDVIGRKRTLLMGYALFLVIVFPLFSAIGSLANPGLAGAVKAAPVVVTGSDCRYDPFSQKGQDTACGKLLDTLTKAGAPYSKQEAVAGSEPVLTIGGRPVSAVDKPAITAALAQAGYTTPPGRQSVSSLATILVLLCLLGVSTGLAYGPVGAWMTEIFPARTRYSSLAISYNFGVGMFAGFMPFIVQTIVALTGNPLAGLWYPFTMVAIGLVVAVVFLPETRGKPID